MKAQTLNEEAWDLASSILADKPDTGDARDLIMEFALKASRSALRNAYYRGTLYSHQLDDEEIVAALTATEKSWR